MTLKVTAHVKQDESKMTRDELITNNMKYAVSICHKYKNCGVPFDDLCQEAFIGLMKAADSFDRKKKLKFITHARFQITAKIMRAIEKYDNNIKQPASHRLKLHTIKKVTEDLEAQGIEPTPDNIIKNNRFKSCKLNHNTIKDALANSVNGLVSLHKPVGSSEDGTPKTFGDYLMDEEFLQPDEMTDRNISLENIYNILDNMGAEKADLYLEYINRKTDSSVFWRKLAKKYNTTPSVVKLDIERITKSIQTKLGVTV